MIISAFSKGLQSLDSFQMKIQTNLQCKHTSQQIHTWKKLWFSSHALFPFAGHNLASKLS